MTAETTSTWPPKNALPQRPPATGDVDWVDDEPSGPEALREAQAAADHTFAETNGLEPGDEVLDDHTIVRAEPATPARVAEAREFRMLPLNRIHPSTTNRTPANVDDLVPSIQKLGVLQPILVRTVDDGYELIAGERRWAAAQKAGLIEIPALVDGDTTDEHALTAQLVENLQREDLDPLHEAETYQALLSPVGSFTQRGLAAAVGVSQGHISKRVALLDLPDAARKQLDSGGITIGDAVTLTKLKDHPKILIEVVKSNPHDVEWAVDRALAGIEAARKAAERRATLEEKGIRVLGAKADVSKFKQLNGYGGLDVDRKKHAKEPCHAVGFPVVGHEVEYCTDPKRHNARGDSPLKVAKKPASTTSTSAGPAEQKNPAEAKKAQAIADAAAARAAFVEDLVRARKIKPDLVIEAVLRTFVDEWVDAHRAAELLGIAKPTKQKFGRPDWPAALSEYSAKGKAELLRAALAGLLADEMPCALRLLLDHGYQPAPCEKNEFDQAKAT